MNRGVIFALAVVTVYIIWLIVFLLVIEPWLRNLIGQLFGLRISRELNSFTGPSSNINLLDILDAYRWKLDRSAGLSVRFGLGLLRIGAWLIALTLPPVLGICVFFGLRR